MIRTIEQIRTNKIKCKKLSHFIKLAEITTDGFEIVKNALSKKDISFRNTYCQQPCNKLHGLLTFFNI